MQTINQIIGMWQAIQIYNCHFTVGKIGPFGCDAHETIYQISVGSDEGRGRARSDDGD